MSAMGSLAHVVLSICDSHFGPFLLLVSLLLAISLWLPSPILGELNPRAEKYYRFISAGCVRKRPWKQDETWSVIILFAETWSLLTWTDHSCWKKKTLWYFHGFSHMAPPYLNHHSVFPYRHWGMQYGHPVWLHSIQTLYLMLQMGFIYPRGCLLMWVFFLLLIYILLRSLPTTWKWFACISFLRSKAHSYTIGHISSREASHFGVSISMFCGGSAIKALSTQITFFNLFEVLSKYKEVLKCLEIVRCCNNKNPEEFGRSVGLGIGWLKKYSWL